MLATTCAIGVYHHYSCELELRSWRGVLDTTLCDEVCQWLATYWWFSLGTPVTSTNKTDRHDITEILLKVALSTIDKILYYKYTCIDDRLTANFINKLYGSHFKMIEWPITCNLHHREHNWSFITTMSYFFCHMSKIDFCYLLQDYKCMSFDWTSVSSARDICKQKQSKKAWDISHSINQCHDRGDIGRPMVWQSW